MLSTAPSQSPPESVCFRHRRHELPGIRRREPRILLAIMLGMPSQSWRSKKPSACAERSPPESKLTKTFKHFVRERRTSIQQVREYLALVACFFAVAGDGTEPTFHFFGRAAVSDSGVPIQSCQFDGGGIDSDSSSPADGSAR